MCCSKPSNFNSFYRYKAEAMMECDPETVFFYVDPVPEGPRAKWDKAVKALELVERLDKVNHLVQVYLF